MKKLAVLLCALALLSGCKGREEARWTPPPLPSTPAPSPTAAEPEKLIWGENFGLENIDLDMLPTTAAIDGTAAVAQGGVDFFLLGTVPEGEISLYGFTLSGSGDGVLLRREDTLTYFSQSYSDGSTLPSLLWRDLDGDGAEELTVSYSLGGGAQAHCAELHVYAWDGGWTDHPFSPDVYNPLIQELLTTEVDGHTLTVSYGRQRVSYTPDAGVNVVPALCDSFENMVFFQLGADRLEAVFGIQAVADGLWDMAQLRAEVVYQDGDFTLQDLRLVSIFGV